MRRNTKMNYATLLKARALDLMSTTARPALHRAVCARCVVHNPHILPVTARPPYRIRWEGEGTRRSPSWPSFVSEYAHVYAGNLVGFA